MELTIDEERKNRYIVVVPDGLAGNLDLAHKVYWMAHRNQYDVLYLALVDEDEKLLSVARSMATMKAATGGEDIAIHSKVIPTDRWLEALREVCRPGDQIVCHEEQSVKDGFLKTKPVREYLQTLFDVPIFTLSGFYDPQRRQVRQWLQNLIAWAGFLIILCSFTLLEYGLDSQYQNFIGKLLFVVLVVIEIGAIWAWDGFTG